MPGGNWVGDSPSDTAVTAGSLTYPGVPTAGGKATTVGDGGTGTRMEPDTLPGGPFHAAGLVDAVSGDIGGGAVEGSLYYRFLAKSNTGQGGGAFAGLELYRDDAEILGVGNNWGANAFSVFGALGNQDLNSANSDGPSDNWENVDTDTHLFIVGIDYHAGSPDDVTVWLDPMMATAEAHQNPALVTFLGSADLSFDAIHLRSGNANSWDFDEIAFASTWNQVARYPEPGTLTLLALGGLGLWRRRRGT